METNDVLKKSEKNQFGSGKVRFSFIISSIFLFLFCSFAVAQPISQELNETENHELTIFVIRSASPLDWESPAKLYQTYKKSVLTNFVKKERTLKGHFFIRLTTPLLDEPLYAGISSADKSEEKKWLFVKKIGLGVLGVGLKGSIQGQKQLIKKIDFHSRKDDMAYLKIKLSASATQRLIDFYNIYTTDFIPGYSPSDFYGGAYWPLYENEGAGCSAFAVALLELIDVKDLETADWLMSFNIPMELIGGGMNNNQKIKVRDIKKTKSWHNGDGLANVDYVPYKIYDPSTTYYWILEHMKPENGFEHPAYLAQSESGIPGLYCDRSSIEVDTLKPIITYRPDNNFFVEYHHSVINKLKGTEIVAPLAGLKSENSNATVQDK